MAFIPAGYFIMGTGPILGKEGIDYGIDEEPHHKVYLGAFYIDKFEVTIGQFREFLKATGRSWEGESLLRNIYPPEIFQNPEELSRYPISVVSWDEADAYCRWNGKRLPTEQEWEKAARGLDGRIYPWGESYDPSFSDTEDLGLNHPAPVGNFPQDKSPFGLFDVSGNVSEWTSSHYLPYPKSRFSINPRWNTQVYVVRGGSFHLPGKLYGRAAFRSLAYPALDHFTYGIRCARDISK